MARIIEINNPFAPFEDTYVVDHPGGVSIFEYLCQRKPGFVEFERPTICVINGEGILRKDWKTRRIGADEIVNFVAIVQAPAVWYVVAVLISIASVAIALSVPKPTTPGQQPEPDPVYSLKGQTNQNRLGAPIEDAYGRCRLFPSYAARPYNKYIDNDQYQYQLLCLGHGEFEIHTTQIEDTDIDNFQDVEYEYYGPGESVELFPDNVVTSVEVGGIELLGTNEGGYAMSGPFTANASGTDANHLEVDVSLPGGLYLGNSKGGLDPLTVTALFEYREIDDSGSPVGSWTTLASFTKTLRTNTPKRFTLEADVTAGRYEVRGRRTNAKNEDTKAANVLRWDGLRAFLPSTKDYGDVTLFAIKARATNNLNDRSSNRINMYATRKLPIWNGTTWSANTATRNPIWAFCNVVRASYGGQLDASYLDLPELLTLATSYASASIHFDFVFEQRLTVWEALKTIARVGRAVPMLEGSLITVIRDVAQTIPTAAFNQHNIVKGSFALETMPAAMDEYDGLEVTYIDQTTWKEETVLCLVGSETGDKPERIKFYGCTDRTRAWREGMYMRRSRIAFRQSVEFSTGLEGHLPSYNDLILVVHDEPNWGKGGEVVAIAGDNVTLTLSEPVTFGVGTYVLSMSKKDGSLTDSIVVTAGATNYEVVLADAVDPSDFYFDKIRERPRFYFGLSDLNGRLCKVTGLYPNSNGTVGVKALIYADVFEDDENDPPAAPSVPIPDSPPEVPVIDCSLVTLSKVFGDERRGLIAWKPTLGAVEYRVEISSNGTDWDLAGVTQTYYLYVDVEPGEALFARVQAVGKGGSSVWCEPTWSGDDAPTLPDDEGLHYIDLLDNTQVTRTVYCRTVTAIATLYGLEEFTDPSSPPKKYLTCTFAGTRGGDVFTDPLADEGDLCSGPYNGKFTSAFSGAATYDDETGTNLTTGDHQVIEYDATDTEVTNNTYDLDGTGFDGDPTESDCGGTITRTKTVWTKTPNGVCCQTSETPFLAIVSDGSPQTATLSNEMTEEMAKDIAFASEPELSEVDYAICNSGANTLPCCVSHWGIRDVGPFQFEVTKAEFKIVLENFTVEGFCRLLIQVYEVDLTTGIAVKGDLVEYETYASILGVVEFEYELPMEEGKNFFIGTIKYETL